MEDDTAEVIKTLEIDPSPGNLLLDHVAGPRYREKRRRTVLVIVLLLLYGEFRHSSPQWIHY